MVVRAEENRMKFRFRKRFFVYQNDLYVFPLSFEWPFYATHTKFSIFDTNLFTYTYERTKSICEKLQYNTPINTKTYFINSA